jgi:hypothetical protein
VKGQGINRNQPVYGNVPEFSSSIYEINKKPLKTYKCEIIF